MSKRSEETEFLIAIHLELVALRQELTEGIAWLKSRAPATKQDLAEMEKRMAKTQSEIAADLRLVVDQLKKSQGEIGVVQTEVTALKTKIDEMQKIIDGMGNAATQELIDAADAVKAQAQVVDDAIPDPVIPPTP